MNATDFQAVGFESVYLADGGTCGEQTLRLD